MTVAEAADAFGISAETFRVRLLRARGALRGALDVTCTPSRSSLSTILKEVSA